jgi:hypothetical protein
LTFVDFGNRFAAAGSGAVSAGWCKLAVGLVVSRGTISPSEPAVLVVSRGTIVVCEAVKRIVSENRSRLGASS